MEVNENLVRENGNQAAAVMADYVAQSSGSGGGVLKVEFNGYTNAINVKDIDGNTLLTTTANVTSNIRHKSYSTTLSYDVIGNNMVYFEIQGVQMSDVQVNYTSPVLPNLGIPSPFIFHTDVQASNSFYAMSPQVTIRFSYSMGILQVNMDLCSASDRFLSQQTGFELFNPNIPQPSGTKCIFRGKICEYTANGYEPIDEVVDGSDTTMSRKIGLDVDNSVFGQLLNMYHNTIIGQLGGGGGE